VAPPGLGVLGVVLTVAGTALLALSSAGAWVAWGGVASSALVLVAAACLGVRIGGVDAGPRGEPAVVLGNGTCIRRSRFVPWAAGNVVYGPAAVGAALIVLSSAGLSREIALILCVALSAPVLLASLRRARWLRFVHAAHFEPPSSALARSVGTRGAASTAWAAVLRLWGGDAPGAERDLGRVATEQAGVVSLSVWFAAGRGELDLDRARSTEADDEGRDLGDRYRWAVATALAALHLGAPERVADRVHAWKDLAARIPNRYGDLLRHLALRVDHDLGRGPPPPVVPDLAWMRSVWPFAV
jgi:hypothetical protein